MPDIYLSLSSISCLFPPEPKKALIVSLASIYKSALQSMNHTFSPGDAISIEAFKRLSSYKNYLEQLLENLKDTINSKMPTFVFNTDHLQEISVQLNLLYPGFSKEQSVCFISSRDLIQSQKREIINLICLADSEYCTVNAKLIEKAEKLINEVDYFYQIAKHNCENQFYQDYTLTI